MGDVTVGSVSVDVVPSARGWIEKLRAQIIPDADRLGIEIGRTLSARINESLGNAHLTVDVDSALADAQLVATEAIVDRLDGRKINLDVGGGGKGAGGIAGFASSLGDSVSSMSALIPLVAVLGTALIPVVASAAGLAAALVLPLAAAGGGLTLFGLLAGKAIGNTNKVAKQIDELKKKAKSLVDPKARAAAAAQAKSLEASLTGPQRAFLAAKESLSKAFSGLLGGKTGDALFAPIVSGMKLLAAILPALSPVIKSVSAALTGLLDSLAKSASGKGFKSFIDGFAQLAGATISGGAKAAGTFIEGLFNIFKDFLPLSSSVGTGLQGLADKFLAFSQKTSTKQGIQSFIEYVKKEGPGVLSAIGNIVTAFVRLGIALAPIGGKILAILTAVARGFNKIPTGLATAILSPILVVGKAIRAVYNTVIGPVFSAIIKAIAKVMQVAGKMLSILGKAPGFGWAKDLGNKLLTAAGHADALADAIRRIPTRHDTKIVITTTHQGGKSQTGGGNTAHVATGGHISGPGTGTSDSIPAMLSNGEFVINAAATKRNLALLHQINSQRYAAGGLAGAPATPTAGGGTADVAANRKLAQLLAQGIRIVGTGSNARLYFEGA